MHRSHFVTSWFAAGAALALAACSSNAPSDAEGAGSESVNTAELAATQPVIWANVGFATPESVTWDPDEDEYLVANINGSPLGFDNNGFISRLDPHGTVASLKWIEGGVNGVTLNGPKGTVLLGNRLWVADIDTVRTFDRHTGAPLGSVQIPGAMFLNALAVRNGKVLVSDTGLDPNFNPGGGDAVYQIDSSFNVTTVSKTTDLHLPNGIEVSCGKTWVVSFGTDELYSLGPGGAPENVQHLPTGSLDGIVALPNGHLLISSWGGAAIYRGEPGKKFKVVISDIVDPAAIGYDFARKRVLVPSFSGNEVRAYKQN